MKNIKTTFDSFLNEELSPKTYLNAGNKLANKGHKNRSKNLIDYGKSLIDSSLSRLQPITITSGGEEVEVKPEYFTFHVFNKIDEESEHGSIVIDWELPIELLEEDDYLGQNIFFSVDFNTNEVLDGPNIDGLLIDNRQSANKIIRLLKDIINIKVEEQPELELILPHLKVNDFYES